MEPIHQSIKYHLTGLAEDLDTQRLYVWPYIGTGLKNGAYLLYLVGF